MSLNQTGTPTGSRGPRSRTPLIVAFALWAAAVAYLTLSPSGYTPPLTLRSFLCFACSELDGSDIIRNWVLFLPGGFLAALALATPRALAFPVLLSCFIEFVQIGVVGRDPALQDLLLDGLGAFSGYALAQHGLPRWGQHSVVAAAAFAWLAPMGLLIPLSTPFDLYGQRTPRFGGTAVYEGAVLESRVGDVSLQSRRTHEKEALDAAIVSRQPVRLSMIVGRSPSTWAPVFQVVDSEMHGILELGALRTDLVLRGRNPARVLKLDQPDARWDGAMKGLSPGDTVALLIERGRNSVCMSLDGRERCSLAPSLGDGWAFVLNLEGPPGWFRELMSMGWAVGLGALIGLASPSTRSAASIAVALALLGYVGATASPDVSADLGHAIGVTIGGLAGAQMRAPVMSLWRFLRAA